MAGLALAGDWLAGMRARIGGGDGLRTTIRASGHRTLSAALAAAGTHPSVLDLDEGALLRVDVPLTIPAQMEIRARGGIIVLKRYGLAIRGTLSAPAGAPVFRVEGTGRVLFSEPPTVTPQNFGAVADGATRCDREIRAAQDSIGISGGTMLWPPGRYLCGSSLFLYGKVDWRAETRHAAQILVAGFEARPSTTFLAVGVTRTEKSARRWSGVCTDLRFSLAPGFVHRALNLISVFDAADYEFSGNLIDGFKQKTTVFKGLNDRNWVDGSKTERARGRYVSNTIMCEQMLKGGEGISVSAVRSGRKPRYASDITISDNHIEGVGDDPIAIHGGERITITGNTCRTMDGRILLRDTEHFVVSDNVAEHTSPKGGIAFIDLGLESKNSTVARPPRNGTISRNRMRVRAGQGIAQAMFLRGAHDLVVEDNEIINESDEITRILLLGESHRGSPLHKYGRVTIKGNRVVGGAIFASRGSTDQDDWVVIGPNSIDGLGKFQNLLRATAILPGSSVQLAGISNVRPGASSVAEVRGHVADAARLQRWSVGALPARGLTELSYSPGLQHLPLGGDRGFIAVEARVTFSRPVSGDVHVEITENGLPKHRLRVAASDGGSKVAFADVSGRELSRKQITGGSSVGVRINDPRGHAAGSAVDVEILGVRMTAIAGT